MSKKGRHINRVIIVITIHRAITVIDIRAVIVIPIAEVDTEEGRQHLTAKTMHAFKYVYDHHYDDADWFMKVRNCLYNVQSQYY